MWLIGKTTLKPAEKGSGHKDSIDIVETLEEAQAKYKKVLEAEDTYAAWLCPVFESSDHELPHELEPMRARIERLLAGKAEHFEVQESSDSTGTKITVTTQGGLSVMVGQDKFSKEVVSVDIRTVEQRSRGLGAVSLFYSRQELMKIGYDRNPNEYAVRQIYSFKDAA